MTPLDAFHQTVHSYPGGCESLGPRLGMSVAVLRNKANPRCNTNHPTLTDVDRVLGITGNYSVLHALAANHSHVCIPVDADLAPSDMAVLELVTAAWRTHGDVGASVDAAFADGRVEAREVTRIREAIYHHIAGLQHMLQRIEQLQEPTRKAAQP